MKVATEVARKPKRELAAMVRRHYAEIWPDPITWTHDELVKEVASWENVA